MGYLALSKVLGATDVHSEAPGRAWCFSSMNRTNHRLLVYFTGYDNTFGLHRQKGQFQGKRASTDLSSYPSIAAAWRWLPPTDLTKNRDGRSPQDQGSLHFGTLMSLLWPQDARFLWVAKRMGIRWRQEDLLVWGTRRWISAGHGDSALREMKESTF